MMVVNESSDIRTGDHYAEAIDLDAGTYRLTVNGEEMVARPLTVDEIAAHAPPPDPRADLAAKAAKATTVAALRAALLDAIALLGD